MEHYLGMDISKGYSDFVFLDSKKSILDKSFQLDDSCDGHQRLINILKGYQNKHNDSELIVGLESTGGYENNWYNLLLQNSGELNLKVARINPFGVNAHGKAELNRSTNDKISARNVAEYLIDHKHKVKFNEDDKYASLRRRWKFVRLLMKQKVQMLNNLESLLYNSNPELLRYCKDGFSGWVIKLVHKYATAIELSRAEAEEVAEIPYISIKKAEDLIESAKSSVASMNDTVGGNMIKVLAHEILTREKLITEQMREIKGSLVKKQLNILNTFKGINDYSAIGLLLFIGDISRFPDVKRIASFFGLHPVYKISGDGIGRVRMSKQGRKEVREILYMVALTAIRCNGLIKAIYENRINKGMNKMKAIGLCMHKILRIIYGMLKNNTNYNPMIDVYNRDKNRENNQKLKNIIQTDRRYQEFDQKAPISRRQKKKRKEWAVSQNNINIIKNGITATTPDLNKYKFKRKVNI